MVVEQMQRRWCRCCRSVPHFNCPPMPYPLLGMKKSGDSRDVCVAKKKHKRNSGFVCCLNSTRWYYSPIINKQGAHTHTHARMFQQNASIDMNVGDHHGYVQWSLLWLCLKEHVVFVYLYCDNPNMSKQRIPICIDPIDKMRVHSNILTSIPLNNIVIGKHDCYIYE